MSTLVSDERHIYLKGKKVNLEFYKFNGEWTLEVNRTFWGLKLESEKFHDHHSHYPMVAFVLGLEVDISTCNE